MQPGCRLCFTDTNGRNYAVFGGKQEYYHWADGNLTHPRRQMRTNGTGGAVAGRRPSNKTVVPAAYPMIE